MSTDTCLPNDIRYTMLARVCACVGMFAGVSADTVSCVLGCGREYLRDVMTEAVNRGYVSKVRYGHLRVYYLTKHGRGFMAMERERMERESLELISRARRAPQREWLKADVVEQMEEAIRSGRV